MCDAWKALSSATLQPLSSHETQISELSATPPSRHPSESWDPVKMLCEAHSTSCFCVLRTHVRLDSSFRWNDGFGRLHACAEFIPDSSVRKLESSVFIFPSDESRSGCVNLAVIQTLKPMQACTARCQLA
jgi:hypothetical protein